MLFSYKWVNNPKKKIYKIEYLAIKTNPHIFSLYVSFAIKHEYLYVISSIITEFTNTLFSILS